MAEIIKSKQALEERAKQLERRTGGRSPVQPDAAVVARPVRNYRALVFQGYLVGATLAFAALFLLARQVAYFSFDLSIERTVQGWHTFWLDVLMRFVSGLGFNPLSYIFSGLIVLLAFVVGLKWEAVMLVFAAAGVSAFGSLFKILAHRERPAADLVNVFSPLHDYSFPSGHVLLFTAFLGFLVFLIYTLAPRSWVRTLGLLSIGGLIALVGLSRVYLGQHWPSDVVGAYLFGSLWLVLTVYVYRRFRPRVFANQPVAPE